MAVQNNIGGKSKAQRQRRERKAGVEARGSEKPAGGMALFNQTMLHRRDDEHDNRHDDACKAGKTEVS
jgi:hypothetical protein